MKAKIFYLILIIWSGVFLANGFVYAQDLSREILVYFTSGVDRDPAGRVAIVHSEAIQRLLARFSIDRSQIVPAFPDFKEADTLKQLPEGRIVKMPNLAKIFVVRVPSPVAREAVIEALKALPGVLFAEKHTDARLFH